MKISNAAHKRILQQIDLLHFGNYDKEEFTGYIPFAYQNSKTEAMDEIYRMDEHVLLHKRTGLRIAYLTTESYDGEKVEYSVLDCFVITRQNQKHSVTVIDLEKQSFETTAGILPFQTVRNTLKEGD